MRTTLLRWVGLRFALRLCAVRCCAVLWKTRGGVTRMCFCACGAAPLLLLPQVIIPNSIFLPPSCCCSWTWPS
jgi:hypothetical protein